MPILGLSSVIPKNLEKSQYIQHMSIEHPHPHHHKTSTSYSSSQT
jgi:hypothetical protein